MDKREGRNLEIDEEATQKTGMKIIETVTKKRLSESTRTKTGTTSFEPTRDDSRVVYRIRVTPLETGSFSVTFKGGKDLFCAIDQNGREIMSVEEGTKSNFPGLLAEAVLRMLVCPCPGERPLIVGDSMSVPQEMVPFARLYLTLELKETGIVNGIRVARLVGNGQETPDAFATICGTLDVCLDLGTGLSVFKKEFETTKTSIDNVDSADTWVSFLQVS